MPRILERLLLGLDGALLLGVLALGFLGDLVPLPKGQDVLVLTRSTSPPEELPTPSVPSPAAPPPEAQALLPAPVPEPEPDPGPRKPGQAEWERAWNAKERGKSSVVQARSADAIGKRRHYAEAKKSLLEAREAIGAFQQVCPEPNPAVEAELSEINMLIMECNKSSPMDLR